MVAAISRTRSLHSRRRQRKRCKILAFAALIAQSRDQAAALFYNNLQDDSGRLRRQSERKNARFIHNAGQSSPGSAASPSAPPRSSAGVGFESVAAGSASSNRAAVAVGFEFVNRATARFILRSRCAGSKGSGRIQAGLRSQQIDLQFFVPVLARPQV